MAAPDRSAGAPLTKPRRRGGREKGFNTPAVQARWRERVREAVALRVPGATYNRIAEQMQVNLRTATLWARKGLALSIVEAGRELEGLMSAFRSGGPRF